MDPHAINLELPDHLRKRKKSKVEEPEPPQERRSSALKAIEEIFNPTFKKPETFGEYIAPDIVTADDVEALNELDERKIFELKEAFSMFDMDNDGIISEEDLRSTYVATGKEVDDEEIKMMMEEAMQPINFDSFVMLMGYKTIELDPEDVLLEAWSKWDINGTGLIDEDRIFFDLMHKGDKFSKTEAVEALREAPLAKPKSLDDRSKLIDYQAFCKMICGLRKRREHVKAEEPNEKEPESSETS
ncbi:myosin regulatory light chain, smooth muscle [Condylostylus longicornis]|uniref:myosin regulatory light chain, smooth muscle n=1 Tax=Condylostylus longicornis TaxID=2530218 RepID=UPI00244E44C9|nr:myosin regulatory light chain, smooth muscle [Condylostylus longicornis]